MMTLYRKLLLTLLIFFSFIFNSLADAPPDPGGGPGGGAGPVGGGAPVGSGLILLLTMSFGFGLKKIYIARNKLAEELSSS